MSSDRSTAREVETDRPDSVAEDGDDSELAAQVELLSEENRRLREAYAEARRSRFRRAALGLAGVGVLAIAGAVAFPAVRTVLLALGGTGLFAAVLSYYLTPERFLSASVSEAVYEALATNGASLAADLGLQDTRVYVPTGTAADDGSSVKLFVPQRTNYAIPDDEALESVLVVPPESDGRGLSLEPTSAALVREFRTALSGEPSDEPDALAQQLADALVEQFELVDAADPDADPDASRVSVAVGGSAFGPVDRFDHPVASFVAAGLAIGVGRPVTVDVIASEEHADYLVTCRWDAE